MNEQKKSGRGCLFWGGIIAGALLLMVCLAMFIGYRFAKGLVNEFTDAEPMALPTVNMSAEEVSRLRNRVSEFSRAVDENRPVQPLVVTTDEINALIATEPDAAQFRNHVYVMIEGDQVKGQVSIPAERFGFKPLRGRYLNATATLNVSLADGLLRVNADALTVKGKPLPDSFMQHVRVENFAQEFNQDPKYKPALDKLETIQVKDGKLIITPKKNQ